jgi:heme-degrading monooxygenase HmoA
MIATIDVADLGRWSLMQAIRRRPAPGDVPGLRWLDIAPGAALASNTPPGFRRVVLFAMWDDEASAHAFADTHPFAQQFVDNGFHAVLRPLRAFGSWPGLPAEVSRNRVAHHDAPVIVTTLGRLRLSQAFRFLRTSRPAERAAINAAGFLWGTAAARPPFVATVSAWSSDEAAYAYAYADSDAGHPRAITQQRRKDFHRESAFIRYAVTSSKGRPPGAPPIEFTPEIES